MLPGQQALEGLSSELNTISAELIFVCRAIQQIMLDLNGTTLSFRHRVFTFHNKRLRKQQKMSRRPGEGRDPVQERRSGHPLSPV